MSQIAAVAPDSVLVIDDDPAARRIVALALRRAGLEVVEASNGAEGLEVVRLRPIGLVVSDLSMPGISGIDVVRALRQQPSTATLPFILMTGSGNSDTVLNALAGGADDFLARPIRLDELVARVRAHLRTRSAWSEVVEDELRSRVGVVSALAKLSVSSVPEEAAQVVVAELAQRTGSDYIGVLQLSPNGRLQPLATFTPTDGVRRSGPALQPARARELILRALAGPWVEQVPDRGPAEPVDAFWSASLDVVAGCPIYSGHEVVALLAMGVRVDPDSRSGREPENRLLAAVIDFASVLGAVAGSAIADRRQTASERIRLRRMLHAREFHPVYQPIVSLRTLETIGYEALTRFSDGTPPDVRFAQAAAVHMGVEYELAAVEAALSGASQLSREMLLAVNISPEVLREAGFRLARVLARADRPIVLELTEHHAIGDYPALRTAIGRLPNVQIAVDDAGAGFASLRHILELRPAFAKLDINLVRGIERDELRQALVAGLVYYARRTGCRLIAEGVEGREESDALERVGIEYAQGFLFARPGALETSRDADHPSIT
jgi:EAL domain-containing protein (putative c-di-GMP-specific phosphodiesterase class I)/DNA-binding response OmpR family regulator